MGYPWPLFRFFGLFQKNIKLILQQINVHLVYGARLQTHDLHIVSLSHNY